MSGRFATGYCIGLNELLTPEGKEKALKEIQCMIETFIVESKFLKQIEHGVFSEDEKNEIFKPKEEEETSHEVKKTEAELLALFEKKKEKLALIKSNEKDATLFLNLTGYVYVKGPEN